MREEIDQNLAIVTGIIWITFIVLVGILHSDPFPGNFLMIAASAFLALVITIIMWQAWFESSGLRLNRDKSYEKSKRTGGDLETALMLLQMLDDNERAMLKQRLLNSISNEDGELNGAGIYEPRETARQDDS